MDHEAWIAEEQSDDQRSGAAAWLADVGGAAAKGAVIGGLFGPVGMLVGATASGAIAAARHQRDAQRQRGARPHRAVKYRAGVASRPSPDTSTPEQEVIDPDVSKELTRALVRVLPELVRALRGKPTAKADRQPANTASKAVEAYDAFDVDSDVDINEEDDDHDDHDDSDGEDVDEAAEDEMGDDDPISWLVG